MGRSDLDLSERFDVGDVVTDRAGNTGYARKGPHGWYVALSEGPLKQAGKKWGYIERFTPQLNYPNGTVRTHCDRCERGFLATGRRLESGSILPRETHCWTHRAYGRQVDQRRAATDGFQKGHNTPVTGGVAEPATGRRDDEEIPGCPF